MKTIVLLEILIFCTGLALLGQESSEKCCRIRVSSYPDEPAHLKITVRNAGSRAITVARTSPEWDYLVRMLSDRGVEPELTEYWKHLISKERGGRRFWVELKNDEESLEEIDLNAHYKLTPGVYRLFVSRVVTISGKEVRLETQQALTIPKSGS